VYEYPTLFCRKRRLLQDDLKGSASSVCIYVACIHMWCVYIYVYMYAYKHPSLFRRKSRLLQDDLKDAARCVYVCMCVCKCCVCRCMCVCMCIICTCICIYMCVEISSAFWEICRLLQDDLKGSARYVCIYVVCI